MHSVVHLRDSQRPEPRLPIAVGAQRWRDLVFVHWNVDAEQVRKHVPRSLALDLLPDGRAVVSLVAFRTEDARVRMMPRWLGLDFDEVNVRTYVRASGHGPGVYFLSLDGASRTAAAGARRVLGLPYFLARLEHRRLEGAVGFRGYRRDGSAPARRVSVLVEPKAELGHEPQFEAFVHERYAMYWPGARGLRCIQVRHERLRVVRAHIAELDETLTRAAGVDVHRSVPTAYYVDQVDVSIFAPELVAPRPHRGLVTVAQAQG